MVESVAEDLLHLGNSAPAQVLEGRKEEEMTAPILVTGAAGTIGHEVCRLLVERGCKVRALVRQEDARSAELASRGVEIVIGDLLDLHMMHRAIEGCDRIYFGMTVSAPYLEATINTAAVAKHHKVSAFVNISQMTVSQMGINATTDSPQQKMHWLAEQALNWSGLPVVHVRPTSFLDTFFLRLSANSIREHQQIRLPFGKGKTSPIASEDVARVMATIVEDPAPHIGKVYELTGPRSQDMAGVAEEFSRALGRPITYVFDVRDVVQRRQVQLVLRHSPSLKRRSCCKVQLPGNQQPGHRHESSSS